MWGEGDRTAILRNHLNPFPTYQTTSHCYNAHESKNRATQTEVFY